MVRPLCSGGVLTRAAGDAIGVTIGVPLLSALAASHTVLLNGIRLALAVNVAATVTIVALVWTGLRSRTHDPVSGAGEPETSEIVGVRTGVWVVGGQCCGRARCAVGVFG